MSVRKLLNTLRNIAKTFPVQKKLDPLYAVFSRKSKLTAACSNLLAKFTTYLPSFTTKSTLDEPSLGRWCHPTAPRYEKTCNAARKAELENNDNCKGGHPLPSTFYAHEDEWQHKTWWNNLLHDGKPEFESKKKAIK